MEIKITESDDLSQFDPEVRDLLLVLVQAFGDKLPEYVTGITENSGDGKYDLHYDSVDVGNAYGEVLATHGWSIVGVHTDEFNQIDRVTVQKIENCNEGSTILYDDRDMNSVSFTEVDEEEDEPSLEDLFD